MGGRRYAGEAREWGADVMFVTEQTSLVNDALDGDG